MKNSGEKENCIAIVTGDVTIYWHIVRSEPLNFGTTGWDPARWATACCQRGGAALLADLVEKLAGRLKTTTGCSYSLFQTGAPRKPVHSIYPHYHHSYALWWLWRGT